MNKRRKGREAALQYLCGRDTQHFEPDPSPEDFWDIRPTEAAARTFAEELVRGVLAHQAELDAVIGDCTENYQLTRISMVDRNILRIALFEMLHCDKVPPIVALNEGIEIAKKFGTSESSRFINGVLDRAKGLVQRDLRRAVPPSPSA